MTPSFDGRMDSGELARVLVDFLREEYESAGFDTAVIGLSGGIDSAVVCTLAAHAFGPENVHAVLMPAASSSPASLSDALLVAESTGVQSRIVGIGPMADAFLATAPDADRVRRGNVFARCRMIVLYDVSAEVGGLVLGTSNKTEILLGYGT
ncbi:MAG: NAD(+) synthase, partial [Gemmatimonadota bacterium]|nr:NAD(+) synthase [Gemmatimonadota bacterium]